MKIGTALKETDRLYVFKELLKADDDIKAGRVFPDSILDEVDKELDEQIARDFRK